MPYKYLKVEMHRVEDFCNLEKLVNIFNTLVQAVRNDIKNSNFSRYYDSNRPDIPPRIEVRINYEIDKEDMVMKKMLQTADKLKENGEVRNHGQKLEGWGEPTFVFGAHEVGTSFALKLKGWLKQNPDVSLCIQENPLKAAAFMAQLVYLILKHAEFDAPLYWNSLRMSPTYDKNKLKHDERIESLAREWASEFTEKLKNIEKHLVPDFLERSIHAFFNCTTTSKIENQVKGWLIESSFWKSTASGKAP